MPYVPVPISQEVPRAAHHGHHAKGAAALNTPTPCSQDSMAVFSLAPHFLTQFPIKLHKDCLPPTATLWNYCRIQFFSLVHSVEGCKFPVVRARLWCCQKKHEVSTLSQVEQELWTFKQCRKHQSPRKAGHRHSSSSPSFTRAFGIQCTTFKLNFLHYLRTSDYFWERSEAFKCHPATYAGNSLLPGENFNG